MNENSTVTVYQKTYRHFYKEPSVNGRSLSLKKIKHTCCKIIVIITAINLETQPTVYVIVTYLKQFLKKIIPKPF